MLRISQPESWLHGKCKYRWWPILVALSALWAIPAEASPVRIGPVEAELIAETEHLIPGQTVTVGLRLGLEDAWHVYWRNPGDAGLAPKVTWDLPSGFSAGELQWPFPEKFAAPPLMSYGYHHAVLLPVQISAPADLVPGSAVTLRARAEWLVCKEACIPGSANLSLTLPVASNALAFNEEWTALFNEARQKLPFPASEWAGSALVTDSIVTLELTAPEWHDDSLTDVTFFPTQQLVIENAAPQRLTRLANGYRLEVERSHYSQEIPDTITGILVTESGWRGPESERALAIVAPVNTPPEPLAATTDSDSLFHAILFALLGGLILNLMPCVLPVLSLKVLGIVNQANDSRRKALGHGLTFTAGVLVSFWALAATLSLLRSGGEQLGWGFQLQSPVFVVVLASFMFLFGLNLLGVFEVGTSLTAVGGSRKRRGWTGSFFNGMLATVVATPCTAPFMGSALGFSLTQPNWVSWMIFTALGLGMAAPYVILSASPALLRFVPKPGRWMETLKHVMGFFLLSTVVWLTWVLGLQAGVNAVGAFLLGLLALATAAWIYGRWGGQPATIFRRRFVQVLSVALLLVGVGAGLFGAKTMAAAPGTLTETSGSIEWKPFNRDQIERDRQAGKIIFIDFTAAWCLSCQVNERVAFGSSEVQQKFDDLDIVAFKADWTSRNEEITRALSAYGRNSVPLYVIYGPESGPIILPEILTPGIVLDALNQIDG